MNEDFELALDLLLEVEQELDGWATAFPDSAGKTPHLQNKIKEILNQHRPTDPEMKILHLVMKGEPYDMIAAGIKREEYRELKEYWHDRFVLESTDDGIKYESWDIIRFRRAYTSTFMDVEFKGISIGKPNPDWTCGLFPPEKCYIISLGEIIQKPKQIS